MWVIHLNAAQIDAQKRQPSYGFQAWWFLVGRYTPWVPPHTRDTRFDDVWSQYGTDCSWAALTSVNSLNPGGFDYSLKSVNFKLILTLNTLSIFSEIVIRWMPQHLTDHESTLVQIMAWCRQATSHCLSQCWPRSLSPYDVTRPQWVKIRHF